MTITHRKALSAVFEEILEAFDPPAVSGGGQLQELVAMHIEDGVKKVPAVSLGAGRCTIW